MTIRSASDRRSDAKRVAIATVLVTALASGCNQGASRATGAAHTPGLKRPISASPLSTGTPPVQTSTASVSATELSQSFASLAKRLGGSIGLAYAPLGRGKPATSLGDLRAGVGWSTMKVPVAIAVVTKAEGHLNRNTSRLIRRAITESDNRAAMALWSRLGSPTAAAAQTQAVLRAGGDTTTVVPSRRLRPQYSPFGQANWSLAAQATFAASLSCTSRTGQVLKMMSQVTARQRWGIGTLSAPVAFKGGWGPGTNGAYLVRQMAVVRLADGSRIGLAIAAVPAGGRFDTGVADLDAVARWFAAHIHSGGAHRC